MQLKTLTIALTLLFVLGEVGAALAKGDPERGRRLARDCFACHGPDGYSPSPINPKIGGQHERYIYLALQQYRDGSRTHSLMRGSVLGRTDQELEDISAYYAEQPGYLTRREIRHRRRDGVPTEEQGGPQQGGPLQGGGAPPKFDHSDQIAKYNSMLSGRSTMRLKSGNGSTMSVVRPYPEIRHLIVTETVWPTRSMRRPTMLVSLSWIAMAMGFTKSAISISSKLSVASVPRRATTRL